MEGMELICFQIISSAGTARSMYIQAISEAKSKNFQEAHNLIKEGAELFLQAHKAHSGLIQKEALGEKVEFSLLLMHAEDQLMATESFKIISQEFIELYESLQQ